MKDYKRLHGKRKSDIMYECCISLAKYLLCIFNFIFFVAGSLVLGVGIWVVVDMHSFISATKLIDNTELQLQLKQITEPTVIEQAAYMLIAAGASMFVVGFLGYCGTSHESRCLLICYGILLVIILLTEITAGCLAAAYREEAEKETRAFLKSSIQKYYVDKDKDAVTIIWDYIMAHMKCCGVDSYEDFKASKKWNEGDKIIPKACCVLKGDIPRFQPKDKDCPYKPSDTNSYWKTGCYSMFIKMIEENIDIIIGIGIGIGLMQLLGIIIVYILCKSMKRYAR